RVDEEATCAYRAELAAARPAIPVRSDERDPYRGARGKHRVLRLVPALASRLSLSEGDLVELVGRNPAPLRAWVTLDADQPDDRVPLDAFARRVLGVETGETVEVRRLAMPSIPGGLAG